MTNPDLEYNILKLRERIHNAAAQAESRSVDITIVAVSKTFPAESVLQAAALGLDHFGENRVEEARTKIPLVSAQVTKPLTWHMVGHLQRRKSKQAVELFDLVHSVDTLGLAQTLDREALQSHKPLAILLEINTSGEPSKFGFPLEPHDQLVSAVGQILAFPNLQVKGLMTIAPIVAKPDDARPYFRTLRLLREEFRSSFPSHDWHHLSMGMTDDFEAAIAEGATLVRIGRAIFGPRSQVGTNKEYP